MLNITPQSLHVVSRHMKEWPITFSGEIIELYLQKVNFLENVMPHLNNLNKETKNKALILTIDVSCCFHCPPGSVFRNKLSI